LTVVAQKGFWLPVSHLGVAGLLSTVLAVTAAHEGRSV
jgi:hypothetical protein